MSSENPEGKVILPEALKSLARLIEDAGRLRLLCEQGDHARFTTHVQGILTALQCLMDALHNETVESIIDSLQRILAHAQERSPRTLDKIDFELVPLMRVLYTVQYFFRCVYPDKALMEQYYREEMPLLGANRHIEEALRMGTYKYDLSIAVLAFNKLEYTKQCVESLLKYMPQDLNYELILINHGSTDGTKEYFESLSPTKQLDILRNGGGVAAYTHLCEGKYFMLVSNDVIVTENAIANMIACMESDEKIAWVVPATSNVSNYQTIPAEYSTFDEMHAFARENNRRSDPCRWEQRTRLVDPISLRRSSVSFSSSGVNWAYYFYSGFSGGFSDDKEALLYRRNGYKMMLAKDSFCYHFGSVTLRDELIKEIFFYDEGRKIFCDAFGVDPWGTGFCWSPEMMTLLQCLDEGHVNILGLNCGIGSNPLKIKEAIKENAHNLDVTLYNATDDKSYSDDLRGTSDIFQFEPDSARFDTLFPGVKFDYIVFESGLEKYTDPLDMLKRIKKRLNPGGVLIIQAPDQAVMKTLCEAYPTADRIKNWCAVPSTEQAMNKLRIGSLLKKGEELFSQGNIPTAIKAFESVLRLDKDNSQALSNLGVIQWHLGEGESAIKIFLTALDINPNDADALANLLRAAMETGRFDLIRADLLERLKLAQPANRDLKALMHACREAVPKP